MKRFALLAALVCAASVCTAAATARSTATNLRCQSGAPATCAVNASSNSVTLDTRAGAYALAYLNRVGLNLGGVTLAHANFSFNFNCSNFTPADPTDCVKGGSPRLSIPLDTHGQVTKTDDVYAFLDPAGCGYTPDLSTSGSVSTRDANCQVTTNADIVTTTNPNGLGVTYPNWAAFAAAHPTWTIRKNHYWFVIADQSFFGLVANLRGWKS